MSGAVCGDMEVTRDVAAAVRRRTYPVAGGLRLTATATEILAAPVLPRCASTSGRPSDAVWAAAQKILDDQGGVCGLVVDRVNILGLVHRLIDRASTSGSHREGQAVALPVGIEPSMTVRGRQSRWPSRSAT